ncbi:MAG: putative DNA-binding domain-containing protein [Gammaproteobacteria bacterium]|nr:putative DNA-binding domain-containing protein [Gammaproteobacteria bacterium]
MPKSEHNFKDIQFEFTAHLRDPEKNSAPANIEDRRMEIYRGLLYKNVQGFLSSGFPVTRKLYNDEDWHKMVRDFFSTHTSHSPYFKDISKEFLIYLNEEREPQPEDPGFLLELTHYEWLEIMLSFLDAEIEWSNINKEGNLLKQIPVLSPLVQLNRYDYPVHKIKPDFQPDTTPEQPTFILVYRDQQDKVGFMAMNPVTARLVELVASNENRTGEEILLTIAKEIPSLSQDVILHGGHSTLTQLRGKDVVLGTRATNI